MYVFQILFEALLLSVKSIPYSFWVKIFAKINILINISMFVSMSMLTYNMVEIVCFSAGY